MYITDVNIGIADLCASHLKQFPQSYQGVAQMDATNPSEIDAKWFSRIAVGESNLTTYAGGPIWNGDSTANDDANDLLAPFGNGPQTEYASLGWGHPINLAVGGDYVPSILYRLYAMEQRLPLNVQTAPLTLNRNAQNALAKVSAPFLVLHVGTNSLLTTEPAPNVVADIEALICELHQDMPLIPKIAMVSIYPRGPFFNLAVSKRRQINQSLALAATKHQFPFVFVDATTYLETICKGQFDSTGLCAYYKDETHPKPPAAYAIDQMIVQALK
jgi:hypothetical protein